MALFGLAGLGMFANSLFVTGTTEGLVAVSLFVLMGEILVRSGTMEVLHDSIDTLIGRLRGRQYILVLALSTVVGSLAGSAMAVAAMLGRSMLPTMVARGYNRPVAAASIMAGSLLAPIIPPSIVAVIIGTLAKSLRRGSLGGRNPSRFSSRRALLPGGRGPALVEALPGTGGGRPPGFTATNGSPLGVVSSLFM